jgi:tripartite-type tricarboxylate transporter receptor subunit TctC
MDGDNHEHDFFTLRPRARAAHRGSVRKRLVAEFKLNAVHVPFKGTGPAVSNVVSGQVDSMIDQVTTVLPYIHDGKIRAIAQLGPKRSPLLPDVASEAATWKKLVEQNHIVIDN